MLKRDNTVFDTFVEIILVGVNGIISLNISWLVTAICRIASEYNLPFELTAEVMSDNKGMKGVEVFERISLSSSR